MRTSALERLEYGKIASRLAGYTVSGLGRKQAEDIKPSVLPDQIRALLQEADEAKMLYEKSSSIPLPSMEGMEWVLGHLGKGYILTETDFSHIGTFLHSVAQLKRFMARWESVSPKVSLYARALHDYSALSEEIDRSIRNGRVSDTASPELGRIRKQMMVQEDRMKKKLDSILSKHRGILQESIVSLRNGRYVIPVKKEHRRLLPGTVLDESASGQTVYVEPLELAGIQGELNELRYQESSEEQKVLAQLTEHVENDEYAIRSDMELTGHYDFLFAKAKYAAAVRGRMVEVSGSGRIEIRQGRHPLLGDSMVPIDFSIGDSYKALMITGPNTGGKTVALKTVGLLTLMVQSGLLPPVGEGSRFAVFRAVEADIGDGQSLEHSLSTFSAHVRNLVDILKEADEGSLILLDELASGTDPGEGIGLSIAVLEELYRRGAVIVATTHYNEIKEFAKATEGFCNARMEFDTETLSPLYKLTIGEAGSSYAFHIALKLGMDPRIIDRSRIISAASGGNRAFTLPAQPEEQRISRHGSKERRPNGRAAAGRNPSETDEPGTNTEADASGGTKGSKSFEAGDCVWIHPLKRTGIVYRAADDKGIVLVQVKQEKLAFNRKRLSLYIDRTKLYPGEDYDMDIVFEDVSARKARKLMNRKHVEGLRLEKKEEKQE
jgi:DNA mismatch repair protein MutS2